MPFYTIAASTNNNTVGLHTRIATSASVRAALWHFSFMEDEATNNPTWGTVGRTTGGTVTNVTPEKADIDSRASDAVGATTASVDPSFVGNPLYAFGVGDTTNIVGNQRGWYAHPRFPIVINVSDFLTLFRSGQSEHFVVFSEPVCQPVRPVRRRGSRRGYWHHQDWYTRCTNPTTSPSMAYGSQFTQLQAETWPESFVPPYPLALLAPPAVPAFDDEEAMYHYHVVNW